METADEANARPHLAPHNEADRVRARAIWLYFVEGMTQNAIARILGINRVAVVRLIADARRRNEVRITLSAPLSELAGLEREMETRFGIGRVLLAPISDAESNPTQLIAAVAASWISETLRDGMTIGVGWGRTLTASIAYMPTRIFNDLRVVSLLGGITAARRFNPAEFAWAFAELVGGEGFLVPAPAIVDSPETKQALLERCGIAEIFRMAERLDVALVSTGAIEAMPTSYRTGHLSEFERRSLIEAGAVGDILYNFLDKDGRLVDHPVNKRAMSIDLVWLRRTPERVLVAGGIEKTAALRVAIKALQPTVMITDEITARAILGHKAR